jgi:hypothetical protein
MDFSSSSHQNIVGQHIDAAQSTLAALKASGVLVRVTKPGQVAAPPFPAVSIIPQFAPD